MSGFFGVVSKQDCVTDLFFGVDYHSHLGTRRGGMAVYGGAGFERAIHNIENAPFRTKFERDAADMRGTMGIGCISDNEAQPLIVRSHLGNFAIVTVGSVTNIDELVEAAFRGGTPHFLEMSRGAINQTELVASIINQRDTVAEGIEHAQDVIRGSLSMLVLTPKGLYAARDRMGRTPVTIGKKEDTYCAAFESFSYLNLGYRDHRELGAGEIVFLTPDGCETVSPARAQMQICSFLWVYYGYPSSTYEGVNVEDMRYRNGRAMAARGDVKTDIVAGVPDSGTAHAIGYANASGIPFSRPLIKYTPTWPRSFMPQQQSQRDLIAKMKLLPVGSLIRDKKILLIDDSIVRGTQLRDTTAFLYQNGAKEIDIRVACPPILFGCKYLNFSRSTSDMELIARRVIDKLEGDSPSTETLQTYADPDSARHKCMTEEIRTTLGFTSLKYQRLDDMTAAIGVDRCKLCTYCWTGQAQPE